MESIDELLERYKVPLLLSGLGIVLIVGGIFASGLNGHSSSTNKSSSSKSSAKASDFPKESIVNSTQVSEFKVDVSGAVGTPGVYSLTSDSRVEDAIKAAGGLKSDANQEYISKSLNLSQKIADGMKIYVPFEGESGAGVVSGVAVTPQSSIVGVNSASADQLDSLPGVGPVTAQKIISGRPYQTLDDLVNNKVVSQSEFTKIKDLIDLN